MWNFLFYFLFIGSIGASNYECPTNVTCIEKETCCQTTTGLWGCCPFENAICCDDGIHCCSKGQICLSNGNCSTSTTNQITIGTKLNLKVKEVKCPGGIFLEQRTNEEKRVVILDGSSCADGSSCCQLSSGDYGCCPIVDAVCCDDHIHCCPSGYECDGKHSKCRKKFVNPIEDVPCPGGTSACPDGETCCQLQSGDYGCCPLSDAVCCSDHIHCCPHGSRCDVEHGQCIQEISIPWLTKKSARRSILSNLSDVKSNEEEKLMIKLNAFSNLESEIICPDATSLCPSSSTCCLTEESTWACCPGQDAVCCSDDDHCCPKDSKCDLNLFKCDHSSLGEIPLLKKVSSMKSIAKKLTLPQFESSISTILCPDEKSFCPDETTCCELSNGVYGCCPYSDGSCCSDKIHCCASGYSCDDRGQRCTRHLSSSSNETISISSAMKISSLKKKILSEEKENFLRLKRGEEKLCPDGKSQCSMSSTCCPNGNGNDPTSYSCCPYSQGVCCGNNGSLCCPNNYDCDSKQLSCQLRENSKFLRSISVESKSYNQCGTSDVACSSDQTCCRTYGSSDGEFACCSFPNAQCCEDGRHCCPQGTICDISSGGCIRPY